MKTFVPNKFVLPWMLVFNLCIVLVASSQGIPQLQFVNGVLESGTAGEDGAKYRFPNITAGVDGVVEIKGRSSSSVVLSSIDTSGPGLGYNQAFQPVLGIPGTAPSLSNWSMDFQLTFYQTGTNKKTKLSQFNATGLDIDGDGSSLSEWTVMKGIQSIDSAIVNSLTFTKLAQGSSGMDYKVEGIIANSPGIDTTARNVMATYKYVKQDQIDFTIGAKTSTSSTTAGMRLNSIWFKDFLGIVLPVKLESFDAMPNGATTNLVWVTASEMNVSHFEIEKSEDGKTFKQVGLVPANGNTTAEITYNFTDMIGQNKNTATYYRLKMVDIDGKLDYSPVRIVRTSAKFLANESPLSYPNPVASELRVTIPASWQRKDVSYSFIKTNGQVVKQLRGIAGSQTETFSVATFAPGIYMLTVTCGNEMRTQKIIKS